MHKYRLAVIPGDGIGVDVIEEGLRVPRGVQPTTLESRPRRVSVMSGAPVQAFWRQYPGWVGCDA
jgi:isocitrate/isopropylmalate dehydrogenase